MGRGGVGGDPSPSPPPSALQREATHRGCAGSCAGSHLRQQDQLQQEAALQELRKLLTTKQEALKQEQEANALAAQENERLREEVHR